MTYNNGKQVFIFLTSHYSSILPPYCRVNLRSGMEGNESRSKGNVFLSFFVRDGRGGEAK